MSDGSGIEWTDATWNPIAGCTKVSEGCRNCYAIRVAARLQGAGVEGYASVVKNGNWTGLVNLVHSALDRPLRWRTPRRVFVNSMSDLFHPSVPPHFVDKVFAVMATTPRHTYQILTKRPERMAEYLNHRDTPWNVSKAGLTAGHLRGVDWDGTHSSIPGYEPWPLRNVWIGTSVEEQAAADERIPHLMRAPAAVRFLSCEPLLGPLDLQGPLTYCNEAQCDGTGIDWVIVGGESGPGARPMHTQWVRDIRDQCTEAGVAFFFKQWGEHLPVSQDTDHPNTPGLGVSDICLGDLSKPGDAWTRCGKKRAGRVLDGRTWDEYPGARV